jgi:hypothetical protein
MGALYRPELKKQYVRAVFLGQDADKTTLSRGGILIGTKFVDADPDALLLMLNREPTKVPAASSGALMEGHLSKTLRG